MFSTYAHQNVRCPCCREDVLLQIFDEPWNRRKRMVFRHPSKRRPLASHFDYEQVTPALELAVKVDERDLDLTSSRASAVLEELITRSRFEIAEKCHEGTKTRQVDPLGRPIEPGEADGLAMPRIAPPGPPRELQPKTSTRRIIL